MDRQVLLCLQGAYSQGKSGPQTWSRQQQLLSSGPGPLRSVLCLQPQNLTMK